MIDRQELIRVLDQYPEHNTTPEVEALADHILALAAKEEIVETVISHLRGVNLTQLQADQIKFFVDRSVARP